MLNIDDIDSIINAAIISCRSCVLVQLPRCARLSGWVVCGFEGKQLPSMLGRFYRHPHAQGVFDMVKAVPKPAEVNG